jgi:hypothetical protein
MIANETTIRNDQNKSILINNRLPYGLNNEQNPHHMVSYKRSRLTECETIK